MKSSEAIRAFIIMVIKQIKAPPNKKKKKKKKKCRMSGKFLLIKDENLLMFTSKLNLTRKIVFLFMHDVCLVYTQDEKRKSHVPAI